MSEKLTKGQKDLMKNAIVRHRFDIEEEKFKKQENSLGSKIYSDLFPKKQREAMAALPKGWLPTTSSLYVKFGGNYFHVDCPENVIPYDSRNNVLKVYEVSHDFSIEMEEIVQGRTNLREEKRKLEAQITAIMDSVTTANKLKSVWPEISEFVDKFAPQGKKSLPAVVINDLNKKLNLPPEEKVA